MAGDSGAAPAPPGGVTGRGPVPAAWLEFRAAFAELAGDPGEGSAGARASARLREVIEDRRRRLHSQPPCLNLHEGIPAEVARAVGDTVEALRAEHERLLDDLAATAADFAHAAENEDRFTVLVFGEVNAGKSALANHLAGLDFDLPEGVPAGECFAGAERVARLRESPTESTREYQGFRLPGLLWIDCPGVLGKTGATGDLARRLAARADFLLFLSSSDAPFKGSEIDVLRRLFETSGNRRLEGCLLLTKADVCEEDEDPATGMLAWQVRPKGEEARAAQVRWCREQLDRSGLAGLVQLEEPLAVSVYVARDRLGRVWESGAPDRPAAAGWEEGYEESGIPALCRLLTGVVRGRGRELKALWPEKRTRALRRTLEQAAAAALDRLAPLSAAVHDHRARLRAAEPEAASAAASQAAAGVMSCLARHDTRGRFVQTGAAAELRNVLREAVEQAVTATAAGVLEDAGRRIAAALGEFVAGTEFDLDVRRGPRPRGRAAAPLARALGGAGGGLAGAAAGRIVGFLLFGVAGSLAGGVAGGLLGGLGGAEIGGGPQWGPSAGDSAGEVAEATRALVCRQAAAAVAAAFQALDQALFAPLVAELDRLQAEVSQWPLLPDGSPPAGGGQDDGR
jgi:hypothetical protein